jgi:UDP-glucuronate decarboxylase
MNKICYLLSFLLCFFSISHAQEAALIKRSLVTGGAGFLGSHMCDRLIEEGYQVVCLDDLSTGNIKNIQHLLENPFFTFIQQDITQSFDFDLPVDEIYNFASPASPPHYQKDPIKTLKTNVLGVAFALELAKKNNAKIFQASTSEVYGDPINHPQQESDWGNVNPIGIRSCYDEGKRCAETLCFDYFRTHGVRIKVGRIFNTYGPRMDPEDGRVISNFIVQALNNAPLTIYGKGDQTRSFCYVSDLIDAIRALMKTPESFLGPVNIGNSSEFTVMDLATKVIDFTKSDSKISFKALPQDDPKKRRPNLDLANQVLGWKPLVPLNEGLEKTIVYFQNILEN